MNPLNKSEYREAMKQGYAFRTMLFNMAPKHKLKGRLTHVQRKILGYTSTVKVRKAKKVERQRRRLGRLHNGRK
jgi:hypothetical protein